MASSLIEAVRFAQGTQDLSKILVTSCVNRTESLARNRIFGKTWQDISGVALREHSCKKKSCGKRTAPLSPLPRFNAWDYCIVYWVHSPMCKQWCSDMPPPPSTSAFNLIQPKKSLCAFQCKWFFFLFCFIHRWCCVILCKHAAFVLCSFTHILLCDRTAFSVQEARKLCRKVQLCFQTGKADCGTHPCMDVESREPAQLYVYVLLCKKVFLVLQKKEDKTQQSNITQNTHDAPVKVFESWLGSRFEGLPDFLASDGLLRTQLVVFEHSLSHIKPHLEVSQSLSF